MTKAMISSTSRDLRAYRQAAIDICNRLGLVPIAMEFFEAMGAGAVEGSRRKVAEADVYVGIFGHRYGYVEPGSDRSVTEIELDRAGELGLERLCFVIDPTHPWPPTAIDYAQHEALEGLKTRLDSSVIRAMFSTVDDFRAKLLQALVEWQRRHPSSAGPIREMSAPRATDLLPPPPSLAIGRQEDLGELRSRLGIGGGGRRRALTVVRGWPGVGKTTLLRALAHDPKTAVSFPDGLLWASIGESPNTMAELAAWARYLGDPQPRTSASIPELMARVRGLLADRRALLLLDDVWEAEDALPLQLAGPEGAVLVTTRFPEIARQIALTTGDIFLLGQLDPQASFELLQHVSPLATSHEPEECRRLADDLEGLPLALIVAGRLLEAEASLGWDVHSLREEIAAGARLLAERAPSDRFDPASGTLPTVAMLLRQSTDRLDEETRARFALLGAMAPKPATFDLAAMAGMWGVDEPKPTARILADRGLLEPLIGTGRFQLHALLVLHARSLLAPE